MKQTPQQDLSSSPLDASFVHLPTANKNSNNYFNNPHSGGERRTDDFELSNQGILDSHRHIDKLMKIAEGHLNMLDSKTDHRNDEECICMSCIER